jgi:simple sugar transport system ATP-binding protein
MGEELLELINISKNYDGVKALDNFSLIIEKGEIHALVGENGSGKSTLLKIVTGSLAANEGSILKIEGKVVKNYKSIDSIHNGIEIIYQDLGLFPNMTVEENISLNQTLESQRQVINWKKVNQIALHAMAQIDINLDPKVMVKDLSIADQQLVAICRSLTQNAKVIIMDEPTSSLTRKEVHSLFSIIRQLSSKGITIIFVSHKLDEVFEIAERITVLRDGKKIGTYSKKETNPEKIASLMTGGEITYSRYSFKNNSGEMPLLELNALSKKDNYLNINLKLYKGEILGIIGPLSSGRTELSLSVFGLNLPYEGNIKINGKEILINSTQKAIQNGIVYVPEDRMSSGVILSKPISSNICLTILNRLRGKSGFLSNKKREVLVKEWVKSLTIKCTNPEMVVSSLSGGNQQKVVLAKWLATEPRIIILDSPTAGIDVGAKSKIYELMRELASKGLGIIMISDEIPEVINNCNRILIMKKGRILKEYEVNDNLNKEALMDEIYA